MKAKVAAIYGDIKKYWNVPREGDALSNKHRMHFCFVGMFLMLFNLGGLGFGGYFAGSIMEISAAHFVTIGIIGMVADNVFRFLSPFHMLLHENLGVLNKKTRKHRVFSTKIVNFQLDKPR